MSLESFGLANKVHSARQEVTSSAVNLSVLYRMENPDMELNLTAQRQVRRRFEIGGNANRVN